MPAGFCLIDQAGLEHQENHLPLLLFSVPVPYLAHSVIKHTGHTGEQSSWRVDLRVDISRKFFVLGPQSTSVFPRDTKPTEDQNSRFNYFIKPIFL